MFTHYDNKLNKQTNRIILQVLLNLEYHRLLLF